MVVNTNCKYIVEHPLQAVGVEELTGLNMTEYHLTSSFPHLEWSRDGHGDKNKTQESKYGLLVNLAACQLLNQSSILYPIH